MGSIAQKLVDDEITRSLTKHKIATNSQVRAEIEARVQLNGTDISICDNNRIMRLDDFIDQLSLNDAFADEFPPAPPRISRRDIVKLRDNFNQVYDGTVVAE